MKYKISFKTYKDKVMELVKPENYKNLTNLAEFLEKDLDKVLNQNAQSQISTEHIPANLELRQKGIFREIYDKLFPVSHVFKVTYQYDREFLSDFMPISNENYIGRGSYKLVYKLPWNHVVKVGKPIFYSDPLFGSLFKEAYNHNNLYLKPEELQLKEFLKSKLRISSKKEQIDLKFARLGMERLHYWKVKGLLPDLVLPTRFYMGLQFRNKLFGGQNYYLTPCDTQPLIPGKHLKEFVTLNEKLKKNPLEDKLFPKWKLNFELNKFGIISKAKLKKIAFNFHRVIEATKYLAKEEKLILDLHSENIIITLPDFELKIFDFHVFDDHLYEPTSNRVSTEADHIETIQKFISSFELGKGNGEP